MAPSILLIRPQMGENIGAAARAMANFGLKELRLVAPRDGWPNPKAGDTAGKAIPILDDAVVFQTAAEAVADYQFVLATTSRERAVNMPAMSARDAMVELGKRQAAGERCAILFGPERTGLENEEVALADAVVMIPVAGEYPSLNLAQAVVVMCYEWFVSNSPLAGESASVSESVGGVSIVSPPPHDSADTESAPPQGGSYSVAPREELLGLFGQLETALDDVNFWRVPEKKEGMWRNIRATLMRTRFTSQEVATWRGIFKAFRGG